MKNSKNTKRALAALSLVLAGGAAAGGTLAYLADHTNTVTNTFAATSTLVDDKDNNFKLDEAPIEYDADKASYVKKAGDRVTTNTYSKLVPGSTAFKDPTVHISDLNTRSYLFIKEDQPLNKEVFEYTVNTTDGKWVPVKGVENVWVWASIVEELDNTGAETPVVNDYPILVDGVKVKTTAKTADITGDLKYTAHLVQATGFNTPEAAWEAYTNPATPAE